MKKYLIIRIVFLVFIFILTLALMFFALRWSQLKRMDVSHYDKAILIFTQMRQYFKGILYSWDWGTQRHMINQGEDVWVLLLSKAPLSLRFTFAAVLFYTVFGILFGILAAATRGSFFDKLIQTFILVFSSIPAFIAVMLMILFFGYYLEWVWPHNPSIHIHGYLLWFKGMIIPTLAIAGLPLARFIRLIRAEMIETFTSDYVLLLRTKGLKRHQIIFKHLIRDCLVPLFPEMLPMFIYTVISAFIVEMVYNVFGIAHWLFWSLFSPQPGGGYMVSIDLEPVLMIGAFYTAMTLVMALLFDVLQVVVDPRIRFDTKKTQT